MAKQVKEEVASNTLSGMEAKYGKGVLMRADQMERVTSYTPTSSLTLNRAIGIGGVPKQGKITHVLGLPSTGKTTLASDIIANEQKTNNMDCALLDIENTYDLGYAEAIGVDLSRLYLVNTKMLMEKKNKGKKAGDDVPGISGEEWLDILGDIISTQKFGIVVLDSIATLCPQSELLAGNEQGSIAGIGRLMSKALRGVTARLTLTDVGLILLNQYRMSPGSYGNPYKEAAGEALKYYASLKIELSSSPVKDGTDIVGLDIRAKITKSKVGIPHREGNYYISFGLGIQKVNEVIDLAEEFKMFEKSGSWYSYEGTRIANGRDNLIAFMKDNEELLSKLEAQVLDRIKNPITETETAIIE